MRSLLTVLFVAGLPACTTSFETPRNFSDVQEAGYQAERQPMSGRPDESRFATTNFQNAGRCSDMDLAGAPLDVTFTIRPQRPDDPILSPGDLLRIDMARGDGFAGDYVVDASGNVQFPFVGGVPAAGFSRGVFEDTLSRLLVEADLFTANFAQTSVSVLQWAPIQVQVSGAVFSTGDKIINQRRAEDDHSERIAAAGDFSIARSLSSALKAASGVRPDADIRNVVLIRNGRRQIFDMSGVINGGPLDDPILVAGDRVHVPSRGCFQLSLARPSRITLPGIRVFMSNLTRPAFNNASSAIGRDATSLPYGTRFLQGLVSANCVGGTQATNAARWGVLISRNPISGESEVIARSIEHLVRRADRDDFNPVLLPGDAIACYDSHITNVRDVIATLSDVASPMINALVIGGLAR